MESFSGEFYDGQSSRKYIVRVSIDEINNKLLVVHESGEEETWAIPDLRISHTGDVTEVRQSFRQGRLLHVTGTHFRKEIRRVLQSKNYDGWYQKLIYAGLAAHITIGLTVLGIAAALYWWVMPLVAEQAVMILPEDYDQAVGKNIYDNMIQHEKIDTTKTALVRAFADELKFNTKTPPQITIVTSKEQNAFAVPDGHIVIYSSLLENMDRHEQLVALLGHESSHAKNRHTMKLLCRNLANYIFISVVFSDVNSIMAIIAENADMLRSMSYSRGFEREADLDGLQMMKDNKVDPEGMPELFQQLQKAHTADVPAFISTHPLTSERIKYIRKKIESSQFDISPNPRLEEIFNDLRKPAKE